MKSGKVPGQKEVKRKKINNNNVVRDSLFSGLG